MKLRSQENEPNRFDRTKLLRGLTPHLASVAIAVWGGPHLPRADTIGPPKADFYGASGGVNESLPFGLAEVGIKVVRTDASWAGAEPSPPENEVHTYRWAHFDTIAKTLALRNQRWYALINSSPTWANDGDENGHPANFAPPRNPAYFAAFAKAFTQRFGEGGTFWAENPNLPYLPVKNYEIWNEENTSPTAAYPGMFWQSKEPPTKYLEMYELARNAIHEAQPKAEVAMGGLLDSGSLDALSWLKELNGLKPGFLTGVEAIGFHPYASSANQVIKRVRELRLTLDRMGGRHVKIEITELGTFRGAATPQQWAKAMEKIILFLARSDCKVTRFMPYALQDESNDSDSETNIGGWYVILRHNGELSVVGQAYRKAIEKSKTAPGVNTCYGITKSKYPWLKAALNGNKKKKTIHGVRKDARGHAYAGQRIRK